MLWLTGLFLFLEDRFRRSAGGPARLPPWALASAVALTLPAALAPASWRLAVGAFTGVAAGLLTFATILQHRYHGGVIPLWVRSEYGALHDYRDGIAALVRGSDLLVFPGVALFVVGFSLAAPGDLAWLGLAAAVAVLRECGKVLREEPWSEPRRLERLGLFATYLAGLLEHWQTQGPASSSDLARVEAFYEQRPAPERCSLRGSCAGKNVLLIQAESLQSFAIGRELGGVPVAPFLAGLRRRAAYYPELYDQTVQGESADAEFAVLNSLHPARRRPHLPSWAENTPFVALPSALASGGYQTLSFDAHHGRIWRADQLRPAYGFRRCVFGEGRPLRDDRFLEATAEDLSSVRPPFFAFVATNSSHYPYREWPGALPACGRHLGAYLNAVHHLDRTLERFLSTFSAETLVVLYGDHSAYLETEDGVWLASHWGVSLPCPRLPLWILGSPLTGTQARPAAQIDLAPTVLYLLGMETPRSFLGRPLVPGQRPFVALPDGTAVGGSRFEAEEELAVSELVVRCGLARRLAYPVASPAKDTRS